MAATRGGFGDLWLFESRTEAYLHPLVQYGDALLTGPDSVCDQYNWLEWGALRRLAGLPIIGGEAVSPSIARQVKSQSATAIFEALVRKAQPAPTDPAEICRIVTQDRRTGTTMAKKKETAPAEQTAAPAAKSGGGLIPAVKGPKDVPLDATIAFGVDKEGVAYGPDHNPKKEGSKTRARFACYVSGMTIQQALDAGITTADLNYDRAHGFISWSGGTAAAEVAPASPVEEVIFAHEAEQEAAD